MEIREISDIKELMDWRREVLAHVFGHQPDDDLLAANETYYLRHIPDGSHRAFVARTADCDCGCGAICLYDELPSPDNPGGRCAYLMNIYVRQPFRNNGIAHAILNRLITEAEKIGCTKIYLETTPDGRPVYTSIGFRDMPDMMKYDTTD